MFLGTPFVRFKGRLMFRIAVIADPHFHDTEWQPQGSDLKRACRSYQDTANSTRVFNESAPALRAALDKAVSEGAKLVIIPGDLTDDGQRHNIEAALAMLRDYASRFDLRYFATPGNHDFYALHGRPQRKEFIGNDGARIVLDSAPVEAGDGALSIAEMATIGTEEALRLMPDLGFMPDVRDIYWETPFGLNPDYASRYHVVRSVDDARECALLDASYLVEPVEGLWILSLDVNICVPKKDATDFSDPSSFIDPTNGGWPTLLQSRPYLLTWMQDVARRAQEQGKTLIAFSHYPALDPLAGTAVKERALFGSVGLARRDPGADVAQKFTATGVGFHLSGHLHVNDTAYFHDGVQGFYNIAVPSTVGFAPAMKMLELDGVKVHMRTLSLADASGFDVAFSAYHREAAKLGEPLNQAAEAPDFGTFMDRHLCDLVEARYFPREWPQDMRAFVETNSFAGLAHLLWGQSKNFRGDDLPLMVFCQDWYRLRKAADLAFAFIPPSRMALYQSWMTQAATIDDAPLAQKFKMVLEIMQAYSERLPTRDCVLDLSRI
ncbi:metallophosphoesterase family protein [Paenochrobactrum pullorum]|uniref:metallophosphoesterase family protein n=1 Tax=Paenochrobactrum pullorum TaxID=1324351 RepID=UPI0035BC93E4